MDPIKSGLGIATTVLKQVFSNPLAQSTFLRIGDSLIDLKKGVDLSNRDLRSVSLDGAKMPEAVLYNANLSGANLERIDLSKANLSKAKAKRRKS